MANKHMNLRVIPESQTGTRGVLVRSNPDTGVMRGTRTDVPDMVCGACGAALTSGVPITRISGVVFKCYCGAFNDATIPSGLN